MSASIALIPLAVALIVSSAESIDSLTKAIGSSKDKANERNGTRSKDKPGGKIKTRFNSRGLLEKTLREHGALVEAGPDDSYIASFAGGDVRYSRHDSNAPYEMELLRVDDSESLVCNIKTIDEEYGGNVQTYTYESHERVSRRHAGC